MQIHFGYAENQHMPGLSGYGVNLNELSFQLYFRSLSINSITLTAFSSRPCLYCSLVVQYSKRLWCSVGVGSIISFWRDKQILICVFVKLSSVVECIVLCSTITLVFYSTFFAIHFLRGHSCYELVMAGKEIFTLILRALHIRQGRRVCELICLRISEPWK